MIIPSECYCNNDYFLQEMTTHNKDYYKKWLLITKVTIINDYL